MAKRSRLIRVEDAEECCREGRAAARGAARRAFGEAWRLYVQTRTLIEARVAPVEIPTQIEIEFPGIPPLVLTNPFRFETALEERPDEGQATAMLVEAQAVGEKVGNTKTRECMEKKALSQASRASYRRGRFRSRKGRRVGQ